MLCLAWKSDMNLGDVAHKAGVSPATVSRVVNGGKYVKATTRTRVLRAMKELRYYPNLHARSLAGGGTRTFGVIVSNLENPFFVDIFQRIESLAEAQGYEVILAATHYDSARLHACIKSMLGRRVAGIAAIVSEMDPSVAHELSHAGPPVVFFDVGQSGKRVTSIKCDFRRGTEQLVEYLYSLGHRRMAFVAYPGHLQSTDDRRNEFLAVMERHCAEPHVVVPGSDGFLGGRDAVLQLLKSAFAPTAILCVNDITAVGVLKALRDHNIPVPAQMSVTGFDNIALSQFSIPALTTVNIPRDQIGQLTFETLASGAADATLLGREIQIDPELIVRQSTAPPRPGN